MTDEEKQTLIEDFKKELANNHKEIADRREKLIRETGHSLSKSRRDYLYKSAKERLRSLFKKKTLHLLVDIDGVISPLHSFEGDYIEVRGNYCNWAIRPKIAHWLEEVHSKSKFVWSSAWEEQANLIFDTLGIPRAEYLSFDEINQDSQWLKIQGYYDYLDKVNPQDTVIIIDDEIPEFDKKLLENRGIIIFKPKGTLGLTNSDLSEVNKIIEKFEEPSKKRRNRL